MDIPTSQTTPTVTANHTWLPAWEQAWASVWAQVAAHMQALDAHPARTVVLLPFFQLQAVARDTARLQGALGGTQGFVPRCETTKSWSQRVGHFMPGPLDISFDAGLDSLRANAWLRRAGLAAKQAMLSGALVQTAHQLGALVAAIPPDQRGAWALQARGQMVLGAEQSGSPSMYEAALARIALEWAVASRYASDVLFSDALHGSLDALVVVQGLQANPLASALAQHWQAVSTTAVWVPPQGSGHVPDHVALHTADSAHDEADCASACVLQHISHGRVPVALAAVDRVTTRRISATLALQGVALQDETGWKLSTTRAAASVMALLRAARWRADHSGAQDALLDWLKHTNAPMGQVNALEEQIRRKNRDFSDVDIEKLAINFIVKEVTTNAPSNVSAAQLLGELRASRSPLQWLASLQHALQASGQWGALMADAAGRDCVQALHLLQPDLVAQVLGEVQGQLQGQVQNSSMSLAQFTAWASDCLENASFKPPIDAWVPQVVVLPLAQVMARPFAALVIAAADEQRLGASPEPVGHWSSAQRQALGLPSRRALAAELEQVWQSALRAPHVDVLWRAAEGEQALQPSPLLQRWLLAHTAAPSPADPRHEITVPVVPTLAPQPAARALRITSLSASSYSDLRTCPYRFFALRLLGLQDAPELDSEVDKRDFGSWLHSVLAEFHVRRKASSGAQTDPALLDQCAHDKRLQDAGFVPFAAAWPQVRQSYLLWLAQHEAEGWQFDQAELERSLPHAVGEAAGASSVQPAVQLKGRIDRVDRLSRGPEAGTAYVLDYKTESVQTSKDRVKNPHEDTQLAFYAALLGEDDIHAAYVNLAERTCSLTAQTQIMDARDALLGGIDADVARIHMGHAMPALGEGAACDYCAARGLCRKDMWTL